jgi:flagellar basal-body rod protein FlgG
MNQSFYTAAVGAGQQQLRLNVQSNNIANVNTYGFKAEKPSFASLMYGGLNGINNENIPRGTGSRMIMSDPDFSGGPLSPTERKYDYAIVGDGFFGLYDPSNGTTSYTRDGSFTLSEFKRPKTDVELESELSDGEFADDTGLKTVYILSDGDGRFVLNREGKPLEVSKADTELPIAVYGFQNTNGMHPVGANRFLPVAKNGQPQLLSNATLQQGCLEASNTDLANELAKVIEAQRSYSYALKMVQTSDEVESTINGLRG